MRRVNLSDVCGVTDGTHYTPPNTDGPFPFLTVKDMTDSGLSFSGCAYIDAAEFERARKMNACPEAGTVLFSKDGTVGKVHVVRHERPFAVLSSIAILRPDASRLDSSFLGFALGNSVVLNDALNRKTGSALQRIILSDLKDVSIPLPELEEQRRIAGRLEQADRLRRTRRYSLELTDTFLPAVFLESFGDPISNPKGWEKKLLGEICTIRRGASPRPIDNFLGGSIPWIKIGDGTKGDRIYITSTQEHVTNDGAAKSVFLKRGSLIFANCGVSCGFARLLKIDGCIHDGWLAFQGFEQFLDPIFLLQAINQITLHLRRLAPEGTQPNLNTGIMNGFAMVVPPLRLQQKLAALVEQLERLRAVQREALRQAEHLFQSLLHDAFRTETATSHVQSKSHHV
jgi:type I restriction enzyme S subunit